MKFGFLTDKSEFKCSNFSIKLLDSFGDEIDRFYNEYLVSQGFIYPPLRTLQHSLKEKREFNSPEPTISSQILFLPRTHEICSSYDDEHNAFLVLGYGFLQGLYLCPEGQGAFGRTPYEPSSINGLYLRNSDREKGMEIINKYFIDSNDEQRTQMRACIHYYLIAYSMMHEWDKFDAYYKVLDGLFRLNFSIGSSAPQKRITHSERPLKLAERYGVIIPAWAEIDNQSGKPSSPLSRLRNTLSHEAIFVNEPVGFHVPLENYSLGLRDFLTKLIAATLGLKTDYLNAKPDFCNKSVWGLI